MGYQVSSKPGWLLEIGSGEAIVHIQDQAVFVSQVTQELEIDDIEPRIGGGSPQPLRDPLLPRCRGHGRGVLKVAPAIVDTEAFATCP